MYIYKYIYLTRVDIQVIFLGIPYLSLYTSDLAKLKHSQDFEGLSKLPRKKIDLFFEIKIFVISDDILTFLSISILFIL